MTVSRRIFTGGAASAATLASLRGARAQAPAFKLKFGADVPDSHPVTIRMREASARILAETGGAVRIDVFPNNQLGSDTDMLSQVRSGGLELMLAPGNVLATLISASALNSVGFALTDYPTVWKAMDGPVGAYIREQIGKAGLVVMDRVWDNGFRQITTREKPIRTPDDLREMKMRVPVSPILISLFKDLGAAPTAINFSELYSALQTRVVDGQENALALISTAKLYEVVKYVALTRHSWDGYWIIANRRAWAAMPKDMAAIAARHIDQSALDQRGDSAKLEDTLQADLTKQGMVFNQPDTAAFKDKLQKAGFYTEWRGKFGDDAWSKLEAVTGALA